MKLQLHFVYSVEWIINHSYHRAYNCCSRYIKHALLTDINEKFNHESQNFRHFYESRNLIVDQIRS